MGDLLSIIQSIMQGENMRGNRFSTDLDINFLLFLRLHRVKAFLQANTDNLPLDKIFVL